MMIDGETGPKCRREKVAYLVATEGEIFSRVEEGSFFQTLTIADSLLASWMLARALETIEQAFALGCLIPCRVKPI